MDQMKTDHTYWVNKTQVLADNYEILEQDGETWLAFKIKDKLVMAVRKNELFQLSINLPIGDGLYQDTIACKHWERHFPSRDIESGDMVMM